MEHNDGGERVYIGIFTGNWKQGLYNNRHSFSNPRLKNQTILSKYFWNLKDLGLTPQRKCKIVRQSSTTNSFNDCCNLYVDEKINIIDFKDRRWLCNERNLFVFKCRHKNKFKLSWFGATDAPTIEMHKDIGFGWFFF